MSRRSQFVCLIAAFSLLQMGWPITGFAQRVDADRLRSKVGVVYRDRQNNLVLDIAQRNIRQGTRVVIITLPGQSVVCCAEVNKIPPAEPEAVQQTIFDDAQSTTYELNVDTKHNDVRFGFGVIDAPGVFSAHAGVVVADLDRDGVRETFRDCTSHEGVHLTIWSGQPLKGAKRWHAYFYLGYETEPSCVQRDFE